ncbi:MAG: PAS domain S-box protein [Actinobacteria bacterium]|nr:PAS domain S-box protein [Actinomycetota bacterium]
MRWRDASIVRRLVVVALFAGLVPGIVGVLLVRSMEEGQLRDQAAARNDAVAQRTAAAIDGRIAGLQSQLDLLASAPAVAALDERASDELAIALRVSGELDRLVLHDGGGRAVAAAAASELLLADDVADREVGPEVRSVGVVATDGRLPALELSVPVEDPPGTVVGSLVGWVPLPIVTPVVEGGGLLGSGRTALLTTLDGTVVAHRELGRVLAAERYPIEDLVAAGVRPGPDDTGRVLVSGARLTSVDAWLVIEQPEDVAVAPADATIDGITLVIAAVVAAIVTSVILAGRGLLRPLGGLVQAVGRLERGERAVRVPTGAAAEVGALADGFNRMAGALDERRAQLEAAETSARRSEERLRLLVEGVEDYAIVLLDRTGRIRSWNTGARRLLGYEAEDAIDRPFGAVFAVADGSDPLLEAARSHRGETEGWCQRGDGRRFWARTVATALADEAGDPYGYAVVVHDLTDRQAARVALEEALAREQQAADELRRTSDLKDEFLAIATHEIRTPLSAILGASTLLTSGWEDLDEADKVRFRDMIATHAQDMRQIVDRLLDFTRLQAGRAELVHERFELREELDRVIAVLDRPLHGHPLVVEAPEVEVELDRDVLRHVVTNLLSNAGKFSPDGSTISLGATVRASGLVIEVRDEGSGIPAEDHDAVFELFRQSRTSQPGARGTGVGLAIVKRYVELAGGEVTLQSAPGVGSTFTVRLPIGTSDRRSGTLPAETTDGGPP